MVPENVTEAPILRFVRRMALLAGAWMLWRVMDVQAATAGAIWE